jgi:stromal membrane-associated protein
MAKSTSTSKLGTVYQMDEIQKLDPVYHKELQQLRRLPENKTCADCGATDSSWTSCNLGVFICINCAQIHRGIGTHVTKVKSTMGTYLWHPDEMEVMRNTGNAKSNAIYLAKGEIPPKGTSPNSMRNHIVDKYEKRKWVA